MIDIKLLPVWLQALILVVLLALVFAAGWIANGWRKDAAIERVKLAHLEQRAKDLQQHLNDLTRAAVIGRQLSARLALAEAERDTISQEKTNALRLLTTGRRCLDADAVRLLNDTGLKPAGVSAAAFRPVSTDAAFATDTDVGTWAAQARRAYDTCRGRLQAIADYYGAIE